MAQQSEPVFPIQRREVGTQNNGRHYPWENMRVADDRADARAYVERMNKRSKAYEYRVDPKRVTKL